MTILYFILAAAALGLLVFIHELGHYFVAKKTGMIVEVFSIGFGKPLIKWRWHNVNWQLGWLPFGGYVKISGMEFGKKDKYSYNDPYQIPNGFFSKSPFRRILVALAGPVANFILAFFIFAIIWGIGGREKPFSDFTRIVGWVEPQSELYALGLRPGDVLTEYNGKPYTGSKDLLYATLLGGKEVALKGFHIDYSTGEKRPFSYQVESYPLKHEADSILTTGMKSGASYLIYDKQPNGDDNPLIEGSPLAGSGLAYQDRFVWADGDYLFSLDQLSHILNQGKALLTVQRGDAVFLTRQPRVFASDLSLPLHVRNELIDWQYEIQRTSNNRSKDLHVLPYIINHDGYVEGPLTFLDKDGSKKAFGSSLNAIEAPLKAGDRILAVDGTTVSHGYQILGLLQQHRVNIIVEKNVSASKVGSWKHEDEAFIKGLMVNEIERIAKHIGSAQPLEETNHYALLKPVESKPLNRFNFSEETAEKVKKEYESQIQQLEKVRDKAKKQQALQQLMLSRQKLTLGVVLQDRYVDYNPAPYKMFVNVFTETWQTLKALFTGYLSPKFVSGPIGIVQVLHHGWSVGLGEALFWIAAISVNLAVLNLLPIPVVDGGYIFLSLWELITGKKLKPKTLERLFIPFAILLIAFFVYLTFHDIFRLF